MIQQFLELCSFPYTVIISVVFYNITTVDCISRYPTISPDWVHTTATPCRRWQPGKTWTRRSASSPQRKIPPTATFGPITTACHCRLRRSSRFTWLPKVCWGSRRQATDLWSRGTWSRARSSTSWRGTGRGGDRTRLLSCKPPRCRSRGVLNLTRTWTQDLWVNRNCKSNSSRMICIL